MTAISSVAFLLPAAVDPPGRFPRQAASWPWPRWGCQYRCRVLGYLLFDEAGAATASVITNVMPVVALFLGVALLGERLTIGAVAGQVLIAIGAWLATSPRAPDDRPSVTPKWI